MNSSNPVTKKGPGRPRTTGIGTQIGMRWHAPVLKQIDAWRMTQSGKPSRPEAIRRLVEQALAPAPTLAPRGKEAVAKASDLARKALDRVVAETESAAPEEQERRKRRLLKGPKEFRDLRSHMSGRRGKQK